jgi:hypothetical protein
MTERGAPHPLLRLSQLRNAARVMEPESRLFVIEARRGQPG